MGTKINGPAPRDIGEEQEKTLRSQIAIAPDLLSARKEYDPAFNELSLDQLDQILNGTDSSRGFLDIFSNDVLPSLSESDAASNRARREADLKDVQELGSQAKDAIEALDPQQASLLRALNNSALSQVEAGASLDPDLRREIQQATRQAHAARGQGRGDNNAFEEVLAVGSFGENLRRSRQSFGQQIAALNQSTGVDPFLSVLGRPGVNSFQGQGLLGQGASMTPNSMFNPMDPMAQQVFSDNFNQANYLAAANAQNNAGIFGGALGMLGNIGGSWIGR